MLIGVLPFIASCSLFDRKNCLQIVCSDYLVKKDVSRIFYMAAESEQDKLEWIRVLRAYDFTKFLTTMQRA